MGEISSEGSYLPIGDYALIGDCRSAALVSSTGSIDWLCWPNFDSPSLFAALLDSENGGRFSVRPEGAFRTEREYLPNSNVLETRFHTSRGIIALRDAMAVSSEGVKRTGLFAEHEIIREIEGLDGSVDLEILFDPRPRYAQDSARLERRGALGICADLGREMLLLRSDVTLQIDRHKASASGSARIASGDRVHLSLSYSGEAPAVIPALGAAAHERLRQSIAWWKGWANRCTYQGPYREEVVRSALALKLMCFAPSGAVIAAPTTSLPEVIGGTRNWDYRFCWLRDASFTLRALQDLGYEEEAAAYYDWLLHATRLTQPELQVLYDAYGEARIPERELPHLEGYAGSKPVRIGNGAFDQLQLDVYGEVLDAVARFAPQGGRLDRDTIEFLEGLGRTVCKRWREPDDGIWESRGGRAHYTYSKALCWVALDCLIRLSERYRLGFDVERFRTEQAAIRTEIEAHGFNERIGSYSQVFDGETVDASLLTLSWYGYLEASDPRMVSTCERIHERLGHDALIYRYERAMNDGLPGAQGAFGICGFWAVETRASGGDLGGATQTFEHLLTYANDVGLFAEEIDPETGAALGNFPQAFTQVGLINAALTLAECDPTRSADNLAVGQAERGRR
jgi:GH15 family glucan-1,4-alpha-glucosidase